MASKNDFSSVILQSIVFNASVLELVKVVARMTTISLVHFGTKGKELVHVVYRLTIYGLARCLPTCQLRIVKNASWSSWTQ
jgi:hypothetical protein